MLDADDSSQGFFDHKESVFTIALSPMHPTLVLTGAGDNAAFLWDFTTGERKATLSGHTDSIIAGGFSADGRLVATASMDATVRVYRVADGSLHRTLEGPAKELEWMEWHPLGPVLAAGSADETVWMWNGDSGECMSVFSGQGGGVTCGGWTADGKTLISCGESGDLIVWNPKSGEASVHLKDIADGPVTSFATHPDKTQRMCITGGADGIVKVRIHTHTHTHLSLPVSSCGRQNTTARVLASIACRTSAEFAAVFVCPIVRGPGGKGFQF